MVLASDLERYMLQLVNQERTSRGLNALVLEQQLNLSAEEHSKWMLVTSIFSHTGINGSSATDRIQAADFNLQGSWRTAENLAVQSERGEVGYFDDVEDLHIALMNSPGHRANILNGDLVYVGIGIETGNFTYDNSQGTFFSVMATQNFGTTEASVILDTGDASADFPITPVTPQNQTLVGTTSDDTLTGGAGNDTISGQFGNDTLRGEGGSDVLRGGFGNDSLFGGDGDDELYGNASIDTSSSNTDSSPVSANNWLNGVTSELLDLASLFTLPSTSAAVGETVLGMLEGNDELFGGSGNDLIYGNGGDDRLYGNAGDDQLFGGHGNDVLEAGSGTDILTGGSGSDAFIFSTNGGTNTINDFATIEDKLQLDDALWQGSLTTAQIVDQFGSRTADAFTLDFSQMIISLSGTFTDAALESSIEFV